MKYQTRRRVVEAEQFFPDKKPWPEGVSHVNMYYGYEWVRGDLDISVEPGEWLVERDGWSHVLSDVDFKDTYEPLSSPNEDSERLDWCLADCTDRLRPNALPQEHRGSRNFWWHPNIAEQEFQTARQAIDAARATSEGGEGESDV